MGLRKKAFYDRNLPRVPSEESSSDGSEWDGDYLNDQLGATLLSNAINWIESLKLPKLRRSGSDNRIFFVTGLKKVVYGTQPAAEVVRIAGIRPPRYLCFIISGSGCDVIQFFLYISLYSQLHDGSLCWALSFGISVIFRHSSHRYLVFGNYVGGYWRSLARMYAGYSIIIVLSTIFNFVLSKYFELPHMINWVVTLLWTGIANFFILKRLWSFDGKSVEDESKFEGVPTGESSDSDDMEMPSNRR